MSSNIKLAKAVNYSKKRTKVSSVTLDNFISIDNILQNKAGITTAVKLPPGANDISAYDYGHILVGNIRPYLKKIWFSNRSGGCSADVLNFEVKDGFDKKFIYYTLLRDDFFAHMMRGSKGSKMPRGDKNQIMEFLIPDFKLPAQQKIAEVLSALDAKIEINKRICDELEQMIKTVYDYWFVQFDFPNEEGKPYQSSGGKMVLAEQLKRKIPEGWEVDNILRVAELLGGGTPKTSVPSFWNGNIPFFTPKDTEDSIFVLKTISYITEAGLNSCSSRLFPKGTIFITARGTVGKVNVAGQDMAMNQSCYALQAKPEINYYYLHQCSENLIYYLKAKSNGSIFNAIVSNDIILTPIAIPPLPLIKRYGEFANALYEKVLVNKRESLALMELREWLLPMIMNGQIKVI